MPGSLVGDVVAVPSFHVTLAAFGFSVALVATLVAASAFAQRLDRVGVRLGFSEALLGVLTAAAADTPELSAALAAILRGERDVGVGVVLGSNAFNLAAMIGVGAMVAGAVRPRRSSLLLEAIVATWMMVAISSLLLGWTSPIVALAVSAVVVVPYVAVLVLGDVRLHLLPMPERVHAVLRDALGGGFAHYRAAPHEGAWWRAAGFMAAAVIVIVAGSAVMVETSLVIADALAMPHALVGLLVLAVVTSLPNMATALRLARQGRGDATVSETMNSNAINLVGGIAIPTAILGVGAMAATVQHELLWLAALTAGTLLALARPQGAGRVAGFLLVLAYLAFVVTSAVGG